MRDQDPITDLRHRVELWNQQMDACLIRGDLQGYAAFYSDDATIIGYDKRKIHGREAIDRFCSEMTGIKEAMAVVLEVGMSGDLIYQVATERRRGKLPLRLHLCLAQRRGRNLPHLSRCL